MWYEINVVLNGKHYFATHQRSLLDTDSAKKMFEDFVKRFPKHEGFNVTVTRYMQTGEYPEWAPQRPY